MCRMVYSYSWAGRFMLETAKMFRHLVFGNLIPSPGF
uniref:Uncharacterized protein n=1 Tax=Arundo donax TaxID=35708 RepID=A0A0A9BJD4_ARUDO